MCSKCKETKKKTWVKNLQFSATKFSKLSKFYPVTQCDGPFAGYII